MENEDAYVRLADEIVLSVVEDYRAAVDIVNDKFAPEKEISLAKKKIVSYENWFLSEYGQLLSRGNGEIIVSGLRKEIKRQ